MVYLDDDHYKLTAEEENSGVADRTYNFHIPNLKDPRLEERSGCKTKLNEDHADQCFQDGPYVEEETHEDNNCGDKYDDQILVICLELSLVLPCF